MIVQFSESEIVEAEKLEVFIKFLQVIQSCNGKLSLELDKYSDDIKIDFNVVYEEKK